MRVVVIVLAALFLGGCSLAAPPLTHRDARAVVTGNVGTPADYLKAQLTRELKALIGSDVHATTSVLGFPDSERTVMGQTIYTWSREDTQEEREPTHTMVFSDFGGSFGSADVVGERTHEVRLRCKVQLAVDAQSKITGYQLDGNYGCRRWALDLGKSP